MRSERVVVYFFHLSRANELESTKDALFAEAISQAILFAVKHELYFIQKAHQRLEVYNLFVALDAIACRRIRYSSLPNEILDYLEIF